MSQPNADKALSSTMIVLDFLKSKRSTENGPVEILEG